MKISILLFFTIFFGNLVQPNDTILNEHFQLATINGTDDRFSPSENKHAYLKNAFNYTGKLLSDDGKCPYTGSGFLNHSSIVTARHVLCGMVEYSCDLSKIVLKTKSATFRAIPYTENNFQCSNKRDFFRLKLARYNKEQGIKTVTKKEAIKVFKAIKKANKGNGSMPSCYVLGVHVDKKKLLASHIRHAKMRLRNGERVIENCSDTTKGSSGGPLVCNVDGEAKSIGVNVFGSNYEDKNLERVKSCDANTLNRNGNAAIFYYQSYKSN